MFYDQAEQVLARGAVLRQGGRQAPLQHARPCSAASTRTRATITRAVTEYEAAKKSCDSNKCNDHKEAFFNLGVGLRRADPAEEERGHPAASVVLEDHLQGRAGGEVRRPVRAVPGDRAPHGRLAPVVAAVRASSSERRLVPRSTRPSSSRGALRGSRAEPYRAKIAQRKWAPVGGIVAAGTRP